jgi:hypothetical protein
MTRLVLLTGEHIVEGIVGMIMFIIVAYLISNTIHASPAVVGGMAFIITWIFRKVSVNIYQYVKNKYKIFVRPLTFNIKN